MRVRHLLASLAWMVLLAATPAGQAPANEPRLPGPVDNPAGTEELVRRARSLANQSKHLESADVWTEAATAEPAIAEFARREAVRSLLAAGDPVSYTHLTLPTILRV